jgi:hypothetical protein
MAALTKNLAVLKRRFATKEILVVMMIFRTVSADDLHAASALANATTAKPRRDLDLLGELLAAHPANALWI